MTATLAAESAHRLITASAGTGKTFQLIHHYIRLLVEGKRPHEILAVTFTRKAAGEILDRIVGRLLSAVDSAEIRDQIAQLIGQPLPAERAERILEQLIGNLHRLQIGTLDAFFGQLARGFALELGLPLGWGILSDLEDRQLRRAAIEAMLAADSERNLLTLVHLLTHGETKRGVAELLEDKVARLYELYREAAEPAWAGPTPPPMLKDEDFAELLDALAALPLGPRMAKARDKDVETARAERWESALGKGLLAKLMMGEDTYYREPIPDVAQRLYRRLIQHLTGYLLLRVKRQTNGAYQLLNRFHTDYVALKRLRRAASFTDVTEQVARGGARLTDPVLGYRLDRAVRHVLLDEFQDTSLIQWQALEPLLKQVQASSDGSVFGVGDPKQAIYGWRGGRPELFDALQDLVPGARREPLVDNYRSAPVVIEAVNQIFQGLTKHPNLKRAAAAAEAFQKSFPIHVARQRWPGYVELAVAPEFASRKAEAAASILPFAAERIRELVAAAPGRSVGVLVRKNDTVGHVIFELRRLGVPASEEGGNPVSDSPAVQMILSALRLADHPTDRVARFHLATGPLGQAWGWGDPRSGSFAARQSRRIRRQLQWDGYAATVLEWAQVLAAVAGPRCRRRLSQVVELAAAYDATASLRADDFIRLLETERMPDPTAADVRVMTVHQSKGLEFDAVFLPELDVPLLGSSPECVFGWEGPAEPASRVLRYVNATIRPLLGDEWLRLFSDAECRDAQESLCLLYVALTRAKHALHLITSTNERERTLPASFAGLLRGALIGATPPQPGTTPFTLGDPHWHRTAEPPEATGPPPCEPLMEIHWTRPVRKPQADSSDEQGEDAARPPLARWLGSGPGGNRQLGLLLHAWLERVLWLSDEPLDSAQMRRIAAREGLSPKQVAEALPDWEALLQFASVRAILDQEAYRGGGGHAASAVRETLRDPNCEIVVRPEQAVLVATERGAPYHGRIDRLVLLRRAGRVEAADIIDYKYHLPPETPPKEYVEQLAGYRRAVAETWGLPPERIATRLVALDADRVFFTNP